MVTRFTHPAFIGFDRLFDEIEGIAQKPSFPPHNLIKLDDDRFRLELAVAGYSQDDLNVVVDKGLLVVEGNKDKDTADYVHKGISSKRFRKEFRLADNVVVNGADTENGLLVIDLEVFVPEEDKPKTIEIGRGKPQQLNG